MDRLEAMSFLLRVADRGNFSAASRELGVPLATLSRKIADLEAHLGTRLLVRTTRRVSLTDVGADYIVSARRILEEVEETERVAAGEYLAPRGELVVTAPLLFGRLHILPVVTDFLAAYPEINIRLVLSDRNLHLLEDNVDMAVRVGPLPDSGMIATRVGSLRRVICASPKLIAVHGTPRMPEDLSGWPIANFDFLAPGNSWSFPGKNSSRRIEVMFVPRLTASTAEAAVEAAVRGVGATCVLHYQCADAVRAKTLKIVLKDYEPEPLPVHLLHAARRELPSKMRVFLDFAAPRVRERLKAP